MRAWKRIKTFLQRHRPAEQRAEPPRATWWTFYDDAEGVTIQAVEYEPDDDVDLHGGGAVCIQGRFDARVGRNVRPR